MKLSRKYVDIKRAGLGLALFIIMGQVAPAQEVQVQKKLDKETTIHEHSPNTALILSAVVPGAGQVYNRQAWKVPIVYAGLAGVGYYTWFNYNEMIKFKDEYLYRVNHDQMPVLEGYESYPTTNIYNLYQSYNKTFQLSIIIGVAVYGLNLLDAYISGHLFNFEMGDEITLNLGPSITSHPVAGPNAIMGTMPSPTMGLTLRF